MTPGSVRAGAGAIVLGGLPIGVFFVLNALRPDLMEALLATPAGLVFARGLFGLSALATAFYLWAALGTFAARWRKNLLIGLTAVVLTVPALLLVVFGPIVFALMTAPAEPP